jgi:hypothetical protein
MRWLPGSAAARCYRAHKDEAGSMVMTLAVTLRSTMPASLDLPLLPMTIRSAPIVAAASTIARPSWRLGASNISLPGPATLCCQSAHQAASSGGGAWRRQAKSGVLLLVAGCLSGWPASASYSQP